MLIFLDESGDIGRTLNSNTGSSWFTISILVCHSPQASTVIKKAVKKTLRRKINYKSSKNHYQHELKGTKTTIATKKYFYQQICDNKEWEIYSILVDKRKLANKIVKPLKPSKVYNTLTRVLFESVDFSLAPSYVQLIVDKSKNKREISEFDHTLGVFLESVVPLNTRVRIEHELSQNIPEIQAIDLFSWGIFKKYESGAFSWYNEFKDRIALEKEYTIF